MRTFIPLLLLPFAFFGVSSFADEAPESDTFFTVSGDVTVTVGQAAATMTKIHDLNPGSGYRLLCCR